MSGVAFGAEEEEGWQASLAVGFNQTSGNSDTSQLNVDLTGENKWDVHELLLGAKYARGEANNVTTTDYSSVFGQYNRLFSDRLYGYVNSSLSQDDIALVDYRFTLGPGVGYYVIKEDNVTLGLEGGLTYIKDKVGGRTDDAIALRFGERYERALSEMAKVWQSLEYLPEVDDFGMHLLNFEIGAEAALGSRMNLRAAFVNRFDSDPAIGRKDNDSSINVALVYKLK